MKMRALDDGHRKTMKTCTGPLPFFIIISSLIQEMYSAM